MPRRLLAANVVLLGVAALCVLSIVRTLTVRVPDVTVRPRPTAPAAAATRAAEPPPSPAAYSVVAARNLFSPTRTEAPPATTQAAAASARLPKPLLFGIVLRDGQPTAYIEDPATKRVAGYRIGDSVAGGTLQKIAADSVVVNRPEGAVDVRLHDPSKPRPAAPPVPGTPPGTIVPKPAVPGAAPSPYPGAVTPPPQGFTPGAIPRRPLPPNLLRRIPPGPPPVAPPPPDARR